MSEHTCIICQLMKNKDKFPPDLIWLQGYFMALEAVDMLGSLGARASICVETCDLHLDMIAATMRAAEESRNESIVGQS